MFKLLLRFGHGLVSLVVIVCLITAGAYAGYALWDNNRIYAEAEDVQADMIQLKPDVLITEEEVETGPSFAELLAINPDVCAWVEMDNTMVDHPVLQGKTNLDYINTDVYGNFSLPGSISSIPAATAPSMRITCCSTATIWRPAVCSARSSCIRTSSSLKKTAPEC